MAWTTPTTRTTGELITASIWNTDLVDDLVALRGGAISIASQAADDFVYAASATALGRVAKASGWPYYSGSAWRIAPDIRSAITISANAITLDLNVARVFTVASVNAAINTTTINNIPASGQFCAFMMALLADGTARTWTWFDSTVIWPSGAAPTRTSTVNKLDVFMFYTWLSAPGNAFIGAVVGQNL